MGALQGLKGLSGIKPLVGGGGASLPVNTVGPLLTSTGAGAGNGGNAVVNVTPGTWTGAPTLTHQFMSGGSPVGAGGTSYTLQASDQGNDVYVVEIPNGDSGAGVSSNQLNVAGDPSNVNLVSLAPSALTATWTQFTGGQAPVQNYTVEFDDTYQGQPPGGQQFTGNSGASQSNDLQGNSGDVYTASVTNISDVNSNTFTSNPVTC